MFRCRLGFVLLLILSVITPLRAHDPGLSSALIKRAAAELEVVLTFAPSDFALLGLTSGYRGTSAADGLVRCYSKRGGDPDVPTTFSYRVSGANEVTVLLVWRQVGSGGIRLEFPILAKLPFGHRMILKMGKSPEAVALLDARHANWKLTALGESTPLIGEPAPTSSFVGLGVAHILAGFDHLCFLLALLLAASRVREVLAVVTTFTVAHSLTLAAAATGAVSLSGKIVEPLIAVSIVYIALENLFLRRTPSHRWAVVFVFGLVHGLGFAGALAERLPGVVGLAVVPPLLAFNAGVELGQLAVAAGLVPMIWLVRTRATLAPRLQPACSLIIAVAGMVWFCQRI